MNAAIVNDNILAFTNKEIGLTKFLIWFLDHNETFENSQSTTSCLICEVVRKELRRYAKIGGLKETRRRIKFGVLKILYGRKWKKFTKTNAE